MAWILSCEYKSVFFSFFLFLFAMVHAPRLVARRFISLYLLGQVANVDMWQSISSNRIECNIWMSIEQQTWNGPKIVFFSHLTNRTLDSSLEKTLRENPLLGRSFFSFVIVTGIVPISRWSQHFKYINHPLFFCHHTSYFIRIRHYGVRKRANFKRILITSFLLYAIVVCL